MGEIMTVNRWHTDSDSRLRNSGDTIDRHQVAVLCLVHEICARIGHPLHDSHISSAARWHDEGERVTGDVPYAIKRDDPVLRAALEAAEYRAMKQMNLPDFPWQMMPFEWAILKAADRAEAWLWAARHTDTSEDRWVKENTKISNLAERVGALEWWQEKTLGIKA